MLNSSFVHSAIGSFIIEVFGYVVEDLKIGDAARSTSATAKLAGIDVATVNFVRVIAVRGQTLCVNLPRPITLLIPGNGDVLTEEECGLTPDKKLSKWVLHKSQPAASITVNSATLEDLITPELPEESRGPTAGLQLSNPRTVNGQACVTVHVWAKWQQCIHIPWDGDKCVTIVDVDDTRDVCVALAGCEPLFSVGPVSLNACFSAPNQLCVTATVSVAGWNGTIAKECVTLPIQGIARENPSNCSCKN